MSARSAIRWYISASSTPGVPHHGSDGRIVWAQADGFGSDSVRLIRQLQKDSGNLQILLFSATFDERVRMFAQKVAGPDANQVILSCPEDALMEVPRKNDGNAHASRFLSWP